MGKVRMERDIRDMRVVRVYVGVPESHPPLVHARCQPRPLGNTPTLTQSTTHSLHLFEPSGFGTMFEPTIAGPERMILQEVSTAVQLVNTVARRA